MSILHSYILVLAIVCLSKYTFCFYYQDDAYYDYADYGYVYGYNELNDLNQVDFYNNYGPFFPVGNSFSDASLSAHHRASQSNGEADVWGNDRVNPCIRFYTGGVSLGLKARNKHTIPGWRTRLHFRGDWSKTTSDAATEDYDNNPEQQRVRCRRKPNWRRFRPFIPTGYGYY